MPRRQPFTALCQHAASLAQPLLADLHTHTTASDGDFTASQVVAFAVQARLKAVAITDHDTMAGLSEAVATIRENRHPIELVPGVEISTFAENRDYHLLAYDVQPDGDFLALLQAIQEARKVRFQQFVKQLEEENLQLNRASLEQLSRTPSVGRRHLAQLVMQSGVVRSQHDAFRRYLLPLTHKVERLRVVTVPDAIDRVHKAGGVASLAHPPSDMTFAELMRFREWGLDAVEVVFPGAAYSRSVQLRQWASELGMACTGGSDCHGPDRRVGSKAIPMQDLIRLRQSASSTESSGRVEHTSSASLRS